VRINVPGEFSGSQIAGSRPAGSSGSWTKSQPPSLSETGASSIYLVTGARTLTQRRRVVVSIGGVAAQEFNGEARAVEPVQSFDRFR
jgi:hypothetical protein